METFGKIVFYLCCFIISAIGQLLTLGYGYEWFLIPLGLPVIKLAHLVGIYLYVRVYTNNISFIKQAYKESLLQQSVTLTMLPWITLFVLYGVHRFM